MTVNAKTFLEIIKTIEEPTLELDVDQRTQIITIKTSKDTFDINGIAVIIGLTGYPMGRAIEHMDEATKRKFSCVMLAKESEKDLTEEEANDTVEEAANIIVGRGVSKINDVFKDKEMRITPPGTICGAKIRIANPKLTSFRVTAETRLGNICMNIGFAEGE